MEKNNLNKENIKIVSIEGIDRSGKSTVFNQLKKDKDLKKEDIVFLKFPNIENVWGQMVYECLRGDNLSKYKDNYTLYNTKDKNSTIEKILESSDKKPKLIIVDRLDATQYVYGKSLGVKNPTQGLHYISDSIIYIDISVKESLKRGNELNDNDLIEGDSIILNLVKSHYDDYFEHKNVYKIDGQLTKDEVYTTVKEVILSYLDK